MHKQTAQGKRGWGKAEQQANTPFLAGFVGVSIMGESFFGVFLLNHPGTLAVAARLNPACPHHCV
jgi:hypothetical protein